MDESARRFYEHVVDKINSRLDQEQIRIDVFRSSSDDAMDYYETLDPRHAAVRVTNIETGQTATCMEFNRRIENQISALLEITLNAG